MPLDRFPGTASRDAHLLVVVAGRAARRKRVVKPEVIAGRYLVGHVGKRRGSFVSGNDEIRIFGIASHDILRCDDLAVNDIVGDVEQAAHKCFVAADSVLKNGITITHWRAFGEKSAFGTGWHDDRVLDDLRLHQAQDFGAKIFAAIRPAYSAARDITAAQVHALDIR